MSTAPPLRADASSVELASYYERHMALRGGVAHVPTAQAGTRSCGSWWTDAKTEVKRSIFMDDYVLSIARDIIHIQDVRSLGTDVNAVPLTAAP